MKPGILRSGLAALLWVMLLLVGSCASEVGDIDRTDPDKLRKADFRGVWYYATTVIEAPVPSPVTFDGEMAYFPGPVKVLFDIQEDYLMVYPTSELYVEGSEEDWHKKSIRNFWDEGKSDEFMEIYVGQPIAAFKIKKHFDVFRKYNAQTGDQSNIIVEDTADRKWFEREYMRVDWSSNSIKDLMYISGTSSSSVDYYVPEYETDNPDRFEMTKEVINFVTKMYLEPSSPDSCSVYMVAPSDCVGVVAKLRHSFIKADPNNDYVPLFYDQIDWMDKYGFFLTERHGYSDTHGLLYSEKISLIQRWNLWTDSRTNIPLLDEVGAQIRCSDDIDCEGLHDGQVHCWIEEGWFSGGHCVTWDPKPIHERGLKPIRYWISANWPEPVKESCYTTADEWNAPFRETVAWTKLYSELGLLNVRYCETHEDCRPEEVDHEATYTDKRPRYCNPDPTEEWEEKICTFGLNAGTPDFKNKANVYCGGDGVCHMPEACSADHPCPLGQTCKSYLCHACPEGATCDDETGAGLEKLEQVMEDRGAFTLYYLKDNGEPRYFKGIEFLNQPLDASTIGNNRVYVGFANLNWNLGLSVKLVDDSGQSICKDADGIDMVFPPVNVDMDKEGGTFVTPGCFIDLPVVPDGEENAGDVIPQRWNIRAMDATEKPPKEIAHFNFVNMDGGSLQTFALVGDANQPYMIHTSVDVEKFSSFRLGGMRFAHAVPGGAPVDYSVQGALVGRTLTFGQYTEYGHLSIGGSRVVILPAGTRGDITCFQDKGVGQCTGWRHEITADDMARLGEIRKSVPDMFVACDNIYTGDFCSEEERGDKSLFNDCRYWYEDGDEWRNPCGETPGATELKKHGDLRYSTMYWVSEDQSSSPLGYGPNAADPDTGEVYYGVANMYGAPMIGYGNYAHDLLDLSTGNLDKDDVMSGKYIREYLDNQEQKERTQSLYAPLPEQDPARRERLKSVRPAVKRFWFTPEERTELKEMLSDEEFVKAIVDPKKFWQTVQDHQPATMSSDQLEARFNKVKGTWIEDLMITEEVKQIAKGGSLGAGDNSISNWDELSPLSWASPRNLEKYQNRLTRLAEHNYYAAEMLEPNVYHTAKMVQEWCADPVEVAKSGWDKYDFTQDECEIWRITKLMLDGTLEHEVGHTVGLRHNFSASTDIFNYHEEYYDIREKEYRVCYLEEPEACPHGDTCRITCEKNEDCMPGTSCEVVDVIMDPDSGDTVETKACLDEHLEVKGWCFGERTQYEDCQLDSECSSLGENARCSLKAEERWGRCEIAATADAQGVCPAGTVNKDGTCLTEDYCLIGGDAKEVDGVKMGRCFLNPTRTCPDPSKMAAGKFDQCSLLFIPYAVDTYAPIKSFAPRSYLTQGERDAGRTEYQYSSLMDYGGTINFDIVGLGKWDEAAIRFGYGELIDTYVDTERLYKEIFDVPPVWGGGSPYSWVSSVFMDTQYYNSLIYLSPWLLLEDFVGVKENLDRIPAPFRRARLEGLMVESDDRGIYDYSYHLPPYENSTDMWRGNLGTYVWDLGADLGEIIDHSWSKLHEYYIFDAFKRERWASYRGANPLGYYNRIISRWFPPFEDAGRYYAMFYNMVRSWGSMQRWLFAGPHLMGRWQDFSDDAMQKMARVLFSPAPGSFMREDANSPNSRYINIGYDTGMQGSEIDVPVGDGKFPYTTFYADAGYYYYDHAAFIGSFWEKMAALYTMTYAMGYFMSDYMGEQVDVGIGTSVGFTNVYYTEIANMVGGFIMGDTEQYAPYVENGKYYFFDPLHPWEGRDMPKLETSLESFSMKAYMMLFGFSFLPTGFDSGFLDSMRLCIKGHASCSEFFNPGDVYGDAFELLEEQYTDPWNKKTYIARTTNYDPNRLNTAYEMLVKANSLKVQWETATDDMNKERLTAKLSDVRDTLDLMFTFNELYGLLQY